MQFEPDTELTAHSSQSCCVDASTIGKPLCRVYELWETTNPPSRECTSPTAQSSQLTGLLCRRFELWELLCRRFELWETTNPPRSQLTAHSSQLTELTELFVHFSMWVFNKFEPIECSVAGRPYKFSSELYRLIAQLVMIRSSSYTIRFLA